MKLAYCGDVCNLCPRYKATINESEEVFEELTELMVKVGWNLDKIDEPEKLKCLGCQDIEKCEYGVKECCIEKKISTCGQCSVYPCSQIKNAFEITKDYAEKFKKILTKDEYAMFNEAFFLKKENLDKQRKKE